MNHKIFVLKTPEDLERGYILLKELRPHLSHEDFLAIYAEAQTADHYELVALEEKNQLVALMGYRFLSDFVRGRHVYVDDLITAETVRSKGFGKILLEHAESIARESGCKSLRLCTGIENERGVKFYESNGWMKRAFAYNKKLDN